MIARIARRILLVLATAAGLGTAAPGSVYAQSAPMQRVPAPDREPVTGLVFPPQIADARKTSSLDYGRTAGRPELGYSWHYQTARLLSATIYVYTLSIRSIPDGPASPVVLAQFQRSLDEIGEAARLLKKYEQVKTVRAPADCPVGGIVFRCVTLSAVAGSTRQQVNTALMVTGYRNNFLKLRLDWPEGSDLGQTAVDRFVQTLVGALLH